MTRAISIQWPRAGVDRRWGYRQQPPYSTADALNVRPRGVSGRERGGSRPGLLSPHYTAALGSGAPVQMLAAVNHVQNDDFDFWADTFIGSGLSASWSPAAWLTASPQVTAGMAYRTHSANPAGVVLADLERHDTTEPYLVELLIVPWLGQHGGTYSIYGRMDNSSPLATANGFVAALTLSAGGAYTGSLTFYVDSDPIVWSFDAGTIGHDKPLTFRVAVSGTSVSCYWGSVLLTTQTAPTAVGRRIGFGISGAPATPSGFRSQVDRFRVQYYRSDYFELRRPRVVASAGGLLYRERFFGEMEQVSSNLTLASDRQILAADRGQRLYIADHGEPIIGGTDGTVTGAQLSAIAVSDWRTLGISTHDHLVQITGGQETDDEGNITTPNGVYKVTTVNEGHIVLSPEPPSGGTCHYRIERGPKVYDPTANTLTLWTTELDEDGEPLGHMPLGCPLITRYRDRLVLAGPASAPHAWFMSRQGCPRDFDYGADPGDLQRAVAGSTASAGQVGEPIMAILSHTDDYLLYGCRDSIWIQRGDPVLNGQLSPLSLTVGVVSRGASCYTPGGDAVFLSRGGLYGIAAGMQSYPQPLSRDRLPTELLNLDQRRIVANLVYDVPDQGIHILLSSDVAQPGTRHWWFDWETKSFWPVSTQSAHDPLSVLPLAAADAEDSAVYFGCRDGRIRRHSPLAHSDDGTAFASHLLYGPVSIGASAHLYDGLLHTLTAELGAASGQVAWELMRSDTAEGVLSAAPHASGTWRAGRNPTSRPRARGSAVALKITGTGLPWEIEHLAAEIDTVGRARVA